MFANTGSWKLKDVLMIAICSVLFGVLLLGATYAGGFISGFLTPLGMSSLGYEPFYGIYFMPAAFAIYIMRKPGTGVITEIIAAVIECLLGNYFGPIVILSGVVQGFGIELPIALKRYKDFRRPVMITSAVVCSGTVVSGETVVSSPDPLVQPTAERSIRTHSITDMILFISFPPLYRSASLYNNRRLLSIPCGLINSFIEG